MTVKHYNLYEFINDIFFNKYLKDISKLLFKQFKQTLTTTEIHNMILLQDYIFINFDEDNDEKIIAIAYVSYTKDYKSLKIKPTYVLLEKLNINEFSDFYMYPYINTFCRDPNIKYRGCGSILINYIFDYFTDRNEEYIYLSAGSTSTLKNNYDNDTKCGLKNYKYNDDNTPYYQANKKLIKYYSSLGFERFENIYSIHLCNYDNYDYVLLEVLRKKLKKNEI